MRRGRSFLIPLTILLLVAAGLQKGGLMERPRHFPKPVYDFSKNPLTPEKIALGRRLFYDPILSADSSTSCASCHSPFNAFAHADHDLSHGIHDQIGTRNAPALFNLAWQPQFMWDGAVNHLDVQALAPISHPKEMGEEVANVVRKLQRQARYRAEFRTAYGDSAIQGAEVLLALSQFQLTLVSCHAKYDSVKAHRARFTAQEERGYALFQQHCNACHREPLFSNYAFASNGLPVDTTLNDYGRVAVTQQPSDSLLFKVPSLRNLGYSPRYMHDGRFRKLQQVLNHYATGIAPGAKLSPPLTGPIPLNADDRVDLIAFLKTLDDRSFVFDPRFQFPK